MNEKHQSIQKAFIKLSCARHCARCSVYKDRKMKLSYVSSTEQNCPYSQEAYIQVGGDNICKGVIAKEGCLV